MEDILDRGMDIETQYLALLHDVLNYGEDRMDRTGTGTRSVFGRTIRCNLADGFPLLTTKKVAFKPVASEAIWFIEGSGDERRLAEILHGTRDSEKKTIWTANAEASYWKPKAKFEGDLGRVYGVQWRRWKKTKLKAHSATSWVDHPLGGATYFGATVTETEIDQLSQILDKIKNNPADRRMVLTAFNVAEMDDMALPPCHMFAQFHTNDKANTLDCLVHIRSNDLFLGLPFNLASYALITEMMAQVTGRKAGELIINIGDAHIYSNHVEQVEQQLNRNPLKLPTLHLNPAVESLFDFEMTDIVLEGYHSHDSIKAPMAV